MPMTVPGLFQRPTGNISPQLDVSKYLIYCGRTL